MDNVHMNERGTPHSPLNGSIFLDSNRRMSSRSSLPAAHEGGGSGHLAQIISVVVRKDKNGYGMKISGDYPVYIQSVREGGAAAEAGLQAGDTIIKVNGIDVIKSTHTEVVSLIKANTHVNLTVKQHQRILRPQISSPIITTHHGGTRPLSHHHNNSTRITAPQPVDNEKLREFENERVYTIRLMLEKEQLHVESLRSELASLSPSESGKVAADLASAERTVGRLQNELQAQLIALAASSSDLSTTCALSHTLPKTLTPNPAMSTSKSVNLIFDAAPSSPPPPPLPHRNSPARAKEQNVTKLTGNSHNCAGDATKSAHPKLFNRPEHLNIENTMYHGAKHTHKGKLPSTKHHHHHRDKSSRHNREAIFYDNQSFEANDFSGHDDGVGGCQDASLVPPPLPPRIPILDQSPSVSLNSSGNVEPDAVNSINKQMSYPLVATCAALVNHSCNPKAPHIVNTHHRTKSSPDPLSIHAAQDANNRLIVSESMNDLSGVVDMRGGRCESWEPGDQSGSHITPPGTPPPPYPSPFRGRSPNTSGSSQNAGCSSQRNSGEQNDDVHDGLCRVFEDQPTVPIETSSTSSDTLLSALPQPMSPIMAANSNVIQQSIISMEDELSDQEVEQIEDGPFKSLSRLWGHMAHLAVFINYILTNCDPSSILFYLITDLYKEGNAKDMKRWAYEIHSSFLVPGSPLRLSNVDENIAREIDDILLKESDKEEILRKIFWKPRAKAKEELNELLSEFRLRRNAGLGTLYGPPDSLMDESLHDKGKENKIIEDVLMKKMDWIIEGVEKEPVDPRRYITAVALSTVFTRIFGLRQAHSDLERYSTFVSREKGLKTKIIGRNRKVNLRGHHFVAHQYYTVTYCNNCQLLLWGIGPQAYQCSNCLSNVHRSCINGFEESCPGPLVKKERGGDPISKFMGRIRSEARNDNKRKSSAHNFLIVEREKRMMEERDQLTDMEERPSSVSVTRSGSDRRSDASEDTPEPDTCDKETVNENVHRLPRPKSTQASINRSESYKEQTQKKRQIRERRKISDPNLSKSNDVDPDISGLSYQTNSGSSSNSSLSSGRSFESPTTSLDTVPMTVGCNAQARIVGDSDPETENLADGTDWISNVSEDIISRLSGCEKKRQEVFNELLQTERSHVRQLRVLETVFHEPLVNSNLLSSEQISLLFPNLDKMLDLHSNFSQAMKALRKDFPLVGDVGEILLNMFDGANGEAFEKAAAEFCARQQIALEWLRERRRKDAKLHSFLTECESDKTCRRLQLKDLIPTGMLRLTKYPLLFENLAKYTSQCLADSESANPLSPQEFDRVHRALERSKEILNRVNAAVREAEDFARLQDIQRRLDRSGFEKIEHPIANEFKNIDITKHKLVFEGPLNWRINNRQRITVHVLLFEDVILLLQKQDDKYSLKFHHTTLPGGTDRTISISPIIRVSTVLVRTNATDNNALYLITTAQNGAQMYDLVAATPSEIKQWFKHITRTTETHKKEERYGRNSPEGSDSENTTDNDSLNRETIPNNDNTSSSVETTDGSKGTDDGNDLVDKAMAEDNTSVGSGDNMPSGLPNIPGAHSPLRLSTELSPLIQPSEVQVSFKPVLTAEPVLTPLEQLRRKDVLIKQTLNEKQLLVADVLSVPREEFNHIADIAAEPSGDKDATELVLAAFSQACQLTEAINDALNVNEETTIALTAMSTNLPMIPMSCSGSSRLNRIPGVPTQKLQNISAALNSQLTDLLKIIKERDEEREKLRSELHKCREQIHIMHELRRLETTENKIDVATEESNVNNEPSQVHLDEQTNGDSLNKCGEETNSGSQ